MGFIGFSWFFRGFLLSLYSVLLVFTGFTRLDWVLLDFTGFYWFFIVLDSVF